MKLAILVLLFETSLLSGPMTSKNDRHQGRSEFAWAGSAFEGATGKRLQMTLPSLPVSRGVLCDLPASVGSAVAGEAGEFAAVAGSCFDLGGLLLVALPTEVVGEAFSRFG